jgi:hypothetical protein
VRLKKIKNTEGWAGRLWSNCRQVLSSRVVLAVGLELHCRSGRVAPNEKMFAKGGEFPAPPLPQHKCIFFILKFKVFSSTPLFAKLVLRAISFRFFRKCLIISILQVFSKKSFSILQFFVNT